MANVTDDWSTNSNDAVNISLVTPTGSASNAISTFHPKFTYPIFGDEESIFGYQGLKIHLRYNACDMRPGLQISYDKKFKAVGDTAPHDIKATLEGYLPATAFDKSTAFEAAINDEIYKEWRPPGELLTSINAGNDTYEIWKGNLTEKPIQQLVNRLQILVPFFIEGGTFINMDDPEWSLERWTLFFLFKKAATADGSPYIFMGYCTVYRYFLLQVPTPPSSLPTSPKKAIVRPATLDFQFPLPEPKSVDIPCRSRISQFIILPSFQAGGNGARFYESIFNFYLNAPETIEITVEDPNEAFDDLRDLNDLSRLRGLPEFTGLRINTDVTLRRKGRVPAGKIVDSDVLDTLRRKAKIAPRQFGRLVEMQLLSLIPTYIRQSLILEKKEGTAAELKVKEHEYHLWQLFVKQRLYRHNKDSLIQLDRSERIDKLEDALNSVEADYARLLRKLEGRSGVKASNGSAEGSSKRPAPLGEENELPTSKKAKVSSE